jgi:hypothetical protein
MAVTLERSTPLPFVGDAVAIRTDNGHPMAGCVGIIEATWATWHLEWWEPPGRFTMAVLRLDIDHRACVPMWFLEGIDLDEC